MIVLQWIFVFVFASNAYALPFSIVPTPGTTLPTVVHIGVTATAYYTVTNNTHITLPNDFVKYLPLNVMQSITPDAIATPATICGTLFTLTPFGTPGDSCILKLIITGPVVNCGCSNHLCLFVCAQRGATCASTPFPLIVSLAPPFIPTVGFFTLAGSPQPLAYISPNQGLSWINVLVPPVNAGPSELTSVSCVIPHCVAAGFYQNGLVSDTITYVSSNEGQTWTVSLPPSVPQGQLFGVSCNGSTCIAVGNTTSGAQTIGYYSLNNGITWTQNNPSLLGAFVNGVFCLSATTCLAVGQQTNAPAIFQTTNSGVSWSTIPVTPPPSLTARLFGVSCNGTNCTAVGFEMGVVPLQPIAYTSANSGSTWSAPIFPTQHPGSTDSRLASVSCSGANCVAVGFFTLAGVIQPLVYTSSNNGNTWTESPTPPVLVGTTQTKLTSVFCSGTICNASGFYQQGANQFPVTYHSTNSGVTWSAPILPPPQGTGSSQLLGIA